MAFIRTALASAVKGCLAFRPVVSMIHTQPLLCQLEEVSRLSRGFSRLSLSRNLELLSVDKKPTVVVAAEGGPGKGNPMIVPPIPARPLVVMLAWMLAERKHLAKYAQIYLDRGYDVLTVHITPWQLIWPVKGTQVVAKELLQFLEANSAGRALFVHGFSVGGYVWGEVMVRMARDLDTYRPLIIDRILGQAWDSAADLTELQVGLPLAVFPNNPLLRTALYKYIGYHLKTFHDAATVHYIRSSQMFHSNLVRRPALLFVSKTDPIGSVSSNIRLKDSWDSLGIKVYWKCWDDSKHVGHFLVHREEYLSALATLLDSLEYENGTEEEEMPQKLQAKL